MGQALKAFAPAEYFPFRSDGMLSFSVIAIELRRMPTFARQSAAAALPAVFRRREAATELLLQKALREAGEPLGFSELCARVGCARSAATRAILNRMCERGLIRCGLVATGHATRGRRSGVAQVFWIEE